MNKLYPNVFSRYTQPTWEFILLLLQEANKEQLILDQALAELTETVLNEIQLELRKLEKRGKIDLNKKINLLEHEEIYEILKQIEDKEWQRALEYYWLGYNIITESMLQTYVKTTTFTINLLAPTIKEIQQKTNFQTRLFVPEVKIVNNNILQNKIQIPWCQDGKLYSERLYSHVVDFQKKLNFILENGINEGKGMSWMIDSWRKLTGATAYNAARLLKTETAAMWSLATKDAYLNMGIEYVEIVGDAACGGICTDYVGEIIPLSDAELGNELPPYHPNCACEYIAYYEEVE